jgi:hypothetical protein
MAGQEIILAPVPFASRCPDYLTHAWPVLQAELLGQWLPALQSRISNPGKLARPVSWSQGRDPPLPAIPAGEVDSSGLLVVPAVAP